MSDELDALTAARLKDLRDHWAGVYQITVDPAGMWVALCLRLPAGPPLTADSAFGLRLAIRADNARRSQR